MSIIEALQRATTAPRPSTTIDINVEPSQREKRPVGRPRLNADPRPPPSEADAPSQAKRKREIIAQRAAEGAEIFAEEERKKKMKNYIKWTGNDKAAALAALAKCKGKRADAIRHIQNAPGFSVNLRKHVNEALLRLWEAAAQKKASGDGMQRGRPPLLLPATVECIRAKVMEAVAAQNQLHNSSSLRLVIASAIADCGQNDILHSRAFKISTTWINKLCRSMKLTMRVPTKASKKIPDDWEAQGNKFMLKLAYLVKTHRLKPDDVYNFDQTAIQFNPQANGGKTRASKGSKDVTVVNHDDKRQITLVPTVNAAGEKLPLQYIVKGTDGKTTALPDYKNNFSNLKKKHPGSIYDQTNNHWASADTNLRLIEEVIIPFAKANKEKRKADGELNVPNKMVIILDCWSVQISPVFIQKVQQRFEDVLLLHVPPNLTGKFQPLDVAVNSVFKGKVKSVYHQWVTNDFINSGADRQNLNPVLMKTNKDSKTLLFDWVGQGWSLTDTATVLRGWQEAGLLKAWDVQAQDEASKLLEEGLLFPAKKEGRGFEMTAVPNSTDAALGVNNDDDEIVYEDDYGAMDDDADFAIIDDDDEEEEDLVAMMEDLCRGDSGSDNDGGCDSAHEDEFYLPEYVPKRRECKRSSQVPKNLVQ